MIRREDVTGWVLAGGRGSRMGGVDKGLQIHRGRPLVAWALARLAPQVATIGISANRHLPDYRRFGVEVLADNTPDFGGPLAGMLTGMRQASTPWLATAPCDTPGFPVDLVDRLAEALDRSGRDIAIPRIQTLEGPRIQPVFALIRRTLEPSLRDFIGAGGSKVRAWLFEQACLEVDFDDPAAFANINTIGQLEPAPLDD